MHLRNHVFDDILQKGSLQNYDSLYNEPLHGPLKDSYQMRTNFKDIESQVSPSPCFVNLKRVGMTHVVPPIYQILEADHRGFVVDHIRYTINFLDDRGTYYAFTWFKFDLEV